MTWLHPAALLASFCETLAFLRAFSSSAPDLLRELDNHLEPDHSGLVVLFSRRGAGKTALTTHWATQHLDHILILNQRHLRVVLTKYIRHYNGQRPHRSRDLGPPQPLSIVADF